MPPRSKQQSSNAARSAGGAGAMPADPSSHLGLLLLLHPSCKTETEGGSMHGSIWMLLGSWGAPLTRRGRRLAGGALRRPAAAQAPCPPPAAQGCTSLWFTEPPHAFCSSPSFVFGSLAWPLFDASPLAMRPLSSADAWRLWLGCADRPFLLDWAEECENQTGKGMQGRLS